MGRYLRFAACHACIALSLCVTGCTISIQPWTKPVTVTTPATPLDPNGAPGGMIPVGPQMPQGLRPNPLAPTTPAAGNEAMSQLIKQFNEAEDLRRALQEQVQTLKKQLSDRDGQLKLASWEMDESANKLKKTRDEFRTWETEMSELRERVRKLEENRRTVNALIEEIVGQLDRPREPLKLPSFDRLPK
jgi:hypothetical protein